MNIPLFAGVIFAVIFFRAADYERLNHWVWSLASVGLTGITTLLGYRLGLMILAQIGLFVAMWWVLARRRAHMLRQYTGG